MPKIGDRTDSGLARKTPVILGAADSDRSPIQAHRWDVAEPQPRIGQRRLNCRTLFPPDPILVRIYTDRGWITRQFSIADHSSGSSSSRPPAGTITWRNARSRSDQCSIPNAQFLSEQREPARPWKFLGSRPAGRIILAANENCALGIEHWSDPGSVVDRTVQHLTLL